MILDILGFRDAPNLESDIMTVNLRSMSAYHLISGCFVKMTTSSVQYIKFIKNWILFKLRLMCCNGWLTCYFISLPIFSKLQIKIDLRTLFRTNRQRGFTFDTVQKVNPSRPASTDHENEGNDDEGQNFLASKQILPTCVITKIWNLARTICTLLLGLRVKRSLISWPPCRR